MARRGMTGILGLVVILLLTGCSVVGRISGNPVMGRSYVPIFGADEMLTFGPTHVTVRYKRAQPVYRVGADYFMGVRPGGVLVTPAHTWFEVLQMPYKVNNGKMVIDYNGVKHSSLARAVGWDQDPEKLDYTADGSRIVSASTGTEYRATN